MSKIKVSELAKEFGISWKELAEEIKNIAGKTVKSPSTKIDEDVVELLREFFGTPEPQEEKETTEEKSGIKVWELAEKIQFTPDEIKEALKALGVEGEIDSFTVVDPSLENQIKEYIQEKRRKEEEERKKKEALKEKIQQQISIAKQEEKTEKKQEEVEKQPEKREEKKEERKEPVVERTEKVVAETQQKEKPKAKEEKRREKQPPKRERREKVERKEKPPKQERPRREEPLKQPEEEKEKEKDQFKEKKTEREQLKLSKEEKAELEALKKLMGTQPKKKKKKKKKDKAKEEAKKEQTTQQEDDVKIAIIPEVITVRELAEILDLPPNQIMADLLKRGILATVNQNIDPEVALQIAEEHGYLAEIQTEGEELSIVEDLPEEEKKKLLEEEEEENLQERPPVVTVMGHVDHGKTTLLDTIRKTDVAAKEKGGITQHIGAYKIGLPDGKEITFLDTPGHEAFTTLRARGSKVADIAVLVVAADDGVKPQTVEAINHAKNAEVPIIVAINKIDKPGADPERVKRELSQYGLIPEEWGGDIIMIPVSAKTGQNIEELLENILLVAEILDLKANPNKPAIGTVIESKLDPKKGAVATVLVENGTLKQGDYFVAGLTWGKVRAMFDERGNQLKEAPPGTPVEILGFNDVPQAGDKFIVKQSEREARQLAEQRQRKREEELLRKARLHFENLAGEKEINIIVKADVQGSLEAILKSLEELSEKFEDVNINVIHSAIGGITESDVMLAAASNAIILGFNVRPDAAARRAAEEENVDIRIYGIIYDLIEDMEKALKGMLEPEEREQLLGTCEVKQIFRIKGVGTVAGCIVTEGVIRRNAKARLVRDGVVIYDGEISSLKRFKDDVKEVAKGYECGLMLKDFNDIKPGDIIEAYEIVKETPAQ
ncbi:MAG: translation initiation factor IF-2 [Aquificae bacterium]|nr:translation initiation factor IF-2 [Aquificota bacterium]